MEIVDENTHRVLAYIETLNRHGVKPTPRQVNEFALDATPRKVFRYALSGMANFRGVLGETDDEPFTDYLRRVAWVTNDHLVQLNDVGRALLRGLNTPSLHESTSDVFEIVLDPANPFAYPQALQALGSTGPAMLVEPYFRLNQLMDVSELENIQRVLLGPRVNAQDRKLLSTGLAALPPERQLEIRVAESLHDRYLIPATNESVLMLGASLGGIGKRVSTLTTLGALASQALREAHEALWHSAIPIAPNEKAGSTSTNAAQGHDEI